MLPLDHATVWTARLVGVTGTIAVGTVLVLNTTGTGFIAATSANRAATERRSSCIAIANGDENTGVQVQAVGIIPANISGLGEGSAELIKVSSSGRLVRTDAYDPDDDVVGYCDADGTAHVMFPLVGVSGAIASPPDFENPTFSGVVTLAADTVIVAAEGTNEFGYSLTGDATDDVIASISIPTGKLGLIKGYIIAQDNDSTAHAYWNIDALAQNVSGTVTILSAEPVREEFNTLGDVTLAASVDGTQLVIESANPSELDITWRGRVLTQRTI